MKNLSARKKLFKQKRFRYILAVLGIISALLGVAIVPVERNLGNITTIFDGVWWTVTTVTTVGYGDFVPVTDAGKVIGIVLQVVGAMMFGIMIAMISNYISRTQDEFYWNRLFERMDRIETELDELKKRTGFMVRHDQGHHDQEHLEEQQKRLEQEDGRI